MPIQIQGANGEDQRLTLTIRLWLSNKLEDHFFGHNPVWKKLQLLNRVIKGGFGTKITVPIKYPAGGGPQAEGVNDPYASRSHQAMTGITSSLWDMAEYLMLISVPDRELVLQGNLTKKLGYLDSVMEIAMDRFQDRLRTHVWGAEGDAGSPGGENQLASIRTLFNSGGASTTGPYTPSPLTEQLTAAVGSGPVTAVGGIERNAVGNAYFCIPVLNPTNAETFGKALVNKMISLSIRNSDRSDLIILNRGHYDTLMGVLQSQRFITESKLTEFGFDAFTWRGNDVIFDDDVPTFDSGTSYNMFAINTKALALCVNTLEPDVKKTEDPERPIEAWKAKWFGSLVMTKMGRGAGARHAKVAA